MQEIKKVFKDSLTGADNATYDIGRIGFALGMVFGLAFQSYEVWHTGKFDGINFGAWISALVAAFGLAAKLKQDTEPKQCP